jgi:hypothetical protein
MGISRLHGQAQLLQDVIRQERIVLSGLRMAELGNQYFREDVLGCEVSAKKVFEAMGVEHVSFDLNGQDGAFTIDLSRYLPVFTPYDIVTNFGTSEHVKDSQYQCWDNIHNLCKAGGWMLHAIPEIGSWPEHGKWHYDLERLARLAAICTYHISLANHAEYTHPDGRKQNSLLLCFRKPTSCKSLFPSELEFTALMFPPGKPHF